MTFISDESMEELFQRFIVNNDYYDNHYLELCVFLVKKDRIADFEHIFNHYTDRCLMPSGYGTDELTDILAYSIIHDLSEIFSYIYNKVWIDTGYARLIIQYKRKDMLIDLFKANIWDDGDIELINMIHEDFLDFNQPWYEGEAIAYSFTKNDNIRDKFLRSF